MTRHSDKIIPLWGSDEPRAPIGPIAPVSAADLQAFEDEAMGVKEHCASLEITGYRVSLWRDHQIGEHDAGDFEADCDMCRDQRWTDIGYPAPEEV